MNTLRLLIVEDNGQDLRSLTNSVKRYLDEKKRHINLDICETFDDAMKKLDNSFDGGIIDLKLGNNGDEGNEVVKKIGESFFRIPIAIFAGNTDSWNSQMEEKIMLIGVFKKTEIEYYDLFDRFWDIFDTGLTRILGGRGKIENLLNKVYLKSLLPQMETWVSYGKQNSKRTEDALLRYALNHLLQLLEEGEERCFPEEVYLHPPLSSDITTGSIVKERTQNQWHVVLSPACDLFVHGDNGNFKTDRILVVNIERESSIVNNALRYVMEMNDCEDIQEEIENKLKEVSNNNHSFYYHWLPRTGFFEGGFLNFRKLETLKKRQFNNKFEAPLLQISPFFVKDIVARFSSFYARQGQPDIDCSDFVARYVSWQQERNK